MTVTAPDLAEQVEQVADWSAPDANGTRYATPREPFWAVWREHKAALRQVGVRVQRRGGAWSAAWTPEAPTVEAWIEQLADWDPPRMVVTSRGPSTCRAAQLSRRLWAAWNERRPLLKDRGVYISQRGGEWQADWYRAWQPDPQIVAAATAAQPAADTAAVPAPDGLEYLPFQAAGIQLMRSRPHNLLADEMGLGKTVQALGLINAEPSIRRVLVAAPASMKLVWRREAAKWLCDPLPAYVIDGRSDRWQPDPAPSLVIVNYDLLADYHGQLREYPWDLAICDEAHALKNEKALRTREVIGAGRGTARREPIPARRWLWLTGTPLLSRPSELWTSLRTLAPDSFPSWAGYMRRYADAHQTMFGMDTSGRSNLSELSTVLHSTVMCRRLKADVLDDLPPKQRQVVELRSGARLRAAVREESRTLSELADLGASPQVAFDEIARVRAETAAAKAEAVCAHLDTLLAGGATKLVVFAHHLAVLDTISERFGDRAVRVDGSVTAAARDRAVERFQTDDTVGLFVGQIDAAGVGLTLTASAHVVFAELPWTPAQLVQAEDRCHRIGQHRPMLSEILVAAGSYDVHMADVIAAKAETVHAAIDRPDPTRSPPPADSAADSVAAVELAARAVEEYARAAAADRQLRADTDQLLAAGHGPLLHDAIRSIAALDGDRARTLNGVGFSRYTTQIGHRVAALNTLEANPDAATEALRVCRIHARQLTDTQRSILGRG